MDGERNHTEETRRDEAKARQDGGHPATDAPSEHQQELDSETATAPKATANLTAEPSQPAANPDGDPSQPAPNPWGERTSPVSASPVQGEVAAKPTEGLSQAASYVGDLPSAEAIQAERSRLQYRRDFGRAFRTTVYALIVVAAAAVLLVTLLFPVLRVTGTSMEPTLEEDDVVILFKTGDFGTGDLCGFYFQNKLLIKRVIAGPGDYVDIDDDGNVFVNGEEIDEPYLTEKALGECDITLPYQVPENRYFVMGDHRATSVDSRSTAIGTIEKDQILGRIMVRVWPLDKLSLVH